jgi:conjugative transfer pilus assembly protein TraH
MKTLIGIGLLGVVLSAEAVASVSSDLDAFVNGLGYVSNTTNPHAFQSQASGYFGAGRLYARNPVHEYQLVTLDLPNVRSGCGGIDAHMGSLSYISGDKLIDLGKSVMTNAGAYAVDVMLATTVPELKQVRDFLQATAQKANQMSINSCEAAQNLVGGIFPKTMASQEKICNDQLRSGKTGGAHDYVQARLSCAREDGLRDTLHAVQADPKHCDAVVLSTNIVWSLLQHNRFLSQDQELAELVMSLTGTYIIDARGEVRNMPSLMEKGELLSALLGGESTHGPAKIWRCDESEHCLNVKMSTLTLPESKSLIGHVRAVIESINTKLKTDLPLSSPEINFLSLTPLPVLKFLMVLNSADGIDASTNLNEYALLIAEDLLQHYLHEVLVDIEQSTRTSLLPQDLIADMRARIREANKVLSSLSPKISKHLTQKLQLINQMVRLEKQQASVLHQPE